MIDITSKSTGMLIDEYITTGFKIGVNPTTENITRAKLLDEVIQYRMRDKWFLIGDLYKQLIDILKECWNAQEVIMHYKDYVFSSYLCDDVLTLHMITAAALTAQKTNAQRNKLIRQIDSLLGEEIITPLGKTYI